VWELRSGYVLVIHLVPPFFAHLFLLFYPFRVSFPLYPFRLSFPLFVPLVIASLRSFANSNFFCSKGVSDKYSWVPQTFSGEGSALLWDNNFNKKAAYDSFLKAIQTTNVTGT
jgi:hypothetical protein